MKKFREFSESVLFVDSGLVTVGPDEITMLVDRVKRNKLGRVRLCAHRGTEDQLHEMFIAIRGNSYIRPHRHVGKSESFHVIDGAVDVVLFDSTGKITEINSLAASGTGANFYHRLSDPLFHTLLVKSEYLVIHEITNGPFQKDQTQYADWAPEENDVAKSKEYMVFIQEQVGNMNRDSARSDGRVE